MPKYDIIDPVEHDGERHESGTIELTAEQAAPLLAVGSVSASKAAPRRRASSADAKDEAEDGQL